REKLFPGMRIGDEMLTSREALVYDQLAESIAVIGAGAVGLEFAYFYQAFGAKVTIIELEKQMLPGFDAEIAEELRRAFMKHKVEVLLGHGYKSAARKGDRWIVTLDNGGQAKTVDAEMVLVAVGRLPNSEGLGLEKIGVEVERGGFIKIDDSFATTRAGIYAIGDVIR